MHQAGHSVHHCMGHRVQSCPEGGCGSGGDPAGAPARGMPAPARPAAPRGQQRNPLQTVLRGVRDKKAERETERQRDRETERQRDRDRILKANLRSASQDPMPWDLLLTEQS